MKINHFGRLYIVPTPLGNLQDISPRAVQILQTVDCIAAEDTRHSSFLLKHYSIETRMISFHEHNERDRVALLLTHLCRGESIALISDAGTPLISDPGYVLVREVRAAGISVVPIPGPCAVITALSAAGLPTDRFIFEGFLPSKATLRQKRFKSLSHEQRTLIFYESPHRVLAFLKDMQPFFGNERIVVIARELTKVFETIHSGTLVQIIEWMENDPNQQRGEFVILVEGSKEAQAEPSLFEADRVLSVLVQSLSLKQAVDIAEKITGLRKNTLYQRALSIKNTD